MEMMIDDIKALIAADESRTLELKDWRPSMCAFLIYVGASDGRWRYAC